MPFFWKKKATFAFSDLVNSVIGFLKDNFLSNLKPRYLWADTDSITVLLRVVMVTSVELFSKTTYTLSYQYLKVIKDQVKIK